MPSFNAEALGLKSHGVQYIIIYTFLYILGTGLISKILGAGMHPSSH